ncbi:MAG: activator of (R)-2-hydroxyglutaryl-CoA dehydratase [Terriglobia bacterium]
MSTSFQPASNPGLVQISATEELIRRRLEAERARLEKKHGLGQRQVKQFHKPVEQPWLASQRGTTTLLFGGLTWKHEKLIHGALEGLGYQCEAVPTPNVPAFQLGKEYGNNGQCNPTYFTVGNLVQFLQKLEEKGLSKREIIDRYVFFTAGACGPCRFGMYEAEYRLALRNAGFDGFRVLLFSQSGGLNQAEAEAGLEMNLNFFLGILNAMNMGDLLNEVGHLIRAYEVNPGDTDRVLEECVDYLHNVLKRKQPFRLNGGAWSSFLRKTGWAQTAEYAGNFLQQLFANEYLGHLEHVRDRLNQIPVDRTRVKPTVKVTGEFWAQTTEGDGNFNMFRFLNREGAELLVEPIGTWIMYMIHQAIMQVADCRGLDDNMELPRTWEIRKRLALQKQYYSKIAKLKMAEKIFGREYRRVRDALGGVAHGLTDQYELQRVAHPYYNSRASGGEGHLEVAKNIYYSNKGIAHMVLSLKPFGCMPSTQSDGAQSAVVSHYKDMIYIPIETSGEGEINAHSRVQMALGEAKMKAKREFKETVASTGLPLDEIKAYVEKHPELQRPMYRVPPREGVVGTAANFVLHVADLIHGNATLHPNGAAAH